MSYRNHEHYYDPTAGAAIGRMTKEKKMKMSRRQDEHKYPLAWAYLDRLQEAERKTAQLRHRKESLQMLLTDRSVHLSSQPHSDSPDLQKMETIEAEIDELEERIAEAEAEARNIRLEVGLTLCRISKPMPQKVLMRHYVENKNMQEIAELYQYCVMQIYRFREAGLKELNMILTGERNSIPSMNHEIQKGTHDQRKMLIGC